MKIKLLFFALLLTANPVFSDSFNLDSLLIKSVGGPKAIERLKQLKTFHAEGSLNWNGMEGRCTFDFMAPDKLRFIADFGEFSIVQGYDGTTSWQQDIHGRVFDLYGTEKSEFMRNLFILSFGYIPFKGQTAKCWYEQVVVEDTFRFQQVICTPEPSDTVMLLFEESSGFLQMVSGYYDNILLVGINAEFDTVENVVIPMYTMTASPQAPITNEVSIESFELDAKIDPSVFSKPKPELFDYHFPADSTSVSIPFTIENGHIIISATVNGIKKGRFILDTGASATYYHSEFVNDMDPAIIGTIPAMGLGGFQDLQMVSFDSINIAGLAMYDQTAGITPLYELQLQVVEDIDFGGILGYDFFVRFPMEFDFNNNNLKVYNPKSFSPPKGGTEIPFNLTMMIPTVTGAVKDVPGEFIVDLGNAFGLILHQSIGEKLLPLGVIDVEGPGRKIGGIGQAVSGIDVEISSMALGTKILDIPEAILVSPSDGLTGSRVISGNIGTGVLKQYTVLFDYPNQRLIIFDP